jgi:O-antigen/teichoic acid export membrane protein
MSPSRLASAVRFLNRNDGSITEKTLRSGIWVTLGTGFNSGVRFVSSMILARLLLPDQFGLMGIAIFFFGVLDVLTQPGLTAAIIHRTDRVREAIDTAWTIFIFRGFLLAALMVVGAPFVAEFYADARLEDIVRVVALAFVVHGFTNAYTITLRKEMNFKRLAISEVVVSMVQMIVVVWVAYVYRSVWALVAGRVTLSALRVIASYVITRERPRFSLPGPLVRELFRYGKFVTGSTIVIFLSANLDKAVIGKVLGTASLGYYVLAYSLATLPVSHLGPIVSKVMFPAFSKVQTQESALREAYLKLLKAVAILALPAIAGIGVLAPQVVTVVYGARWLPMLGALYVLVWFGAVRVLAATTEPVFLATGRPHVIFYLSTVRLVLIALLLYPLAARFELRGAALAVTIPVALEQAALWLLLKRAIRCTGGAILKSVAAPVFAVAVMVGCVWAARHLLPEIPTELGLVCYVSLGVIVYVSLIRLIEPGFWRQLRGYVGGVFARTG